MTAKEILILILVISAIFAIGWQVEKSRQCGEYNKTKKDFGCEMRDGKLWCEKPYPGSFVIGMDEMIRKCE